MHATIYGTGYVGLVQAAVLAESGCVVVCVDIDAHRIDRLKRGECPIFEPGLERLLQENVAAGRLVFTTDAAEGVAHATVQFIAVGTPSVKDGAADLQYVFAVADSIGSLMEDHKVVVMKSTVPVGTSDKVNLFYLEELAA